MNDGEIKERLRDRNPWWRDAREWSRRDDVLREASDAPFGYDADVLRAIDAPSLYVIVGPRRVGKSVALRRKIRELIDWKSEAQSARANFERGSLATRRAHDLDGTIWATPAPSVAWLLDRS